VCRCRYIDKVHASDALTRLRPKTRELLHGAATPPPPRNRRVSTHGKVMVHTYGAPQLGSSEEESEEEEGGGGGDDGGGASDQNAGLAPTGPDAPPTASGSDVVADEVDMDPAEASPAPPPPPPAPPPPEVVALSALSAHELAHATARGRSEDGGDSSGRDSFGGGRMNVSASSSAYGDGGGSDGGGGYDSGVDGAGGGGYAYVRADVGAASGSQPSDGYAQSASELRAADSVASSSHRPSRVLAEAIAGRLLSAPQQPLPAAQQQQQRRRGGGRPPPQPLASPRSILAPGYADDGGPVDMPRARAAAAAARSGAAAAHGGTAAAGAASSAASSAYSDWGVTSDVDSRGYPARFAVQQPPPTAAPLPAAGRRKR